MRPREGATVISPSSFWRCAPSLPFSASAEGRPSLHGQRPPMSISGARSGPDSKLEVVAMLVPRTFFDTRRRTFRIGDNGHLFHPAIVGYTPCPARLCCRLIRCYHPFHLNRPRSCPLRVCGRAALGLAPEAETGRRARAFRRHPIRREPSPGSLRKHAAILDDLDP